MFLVKQLSNFLWGEKRDLQITGKFYISTNDRKKWKCLFNDCNLLLSRSEGEWRYKITVLRSEETVTESDPEEICEYLFLIERHMDFAEDEGLCGGTAFSWTDTENANDTKGKRFLFEFDNNDKMVDLFKLAVCQSLYETTYHNSHQNASMEDLLSFCKKYRSSSPSTPVSQTNSPLSSSVVQSNSPPSSPVPHSPSSPFKTPVQSPSSKQDVINVSEYQIPTPKKVSSENVAYQCQADLYLYDLNIQQFTLLCGSVSVSLDCINKQNYDYSLSIKDQNDKLLIAQPVDNRMFMHFSSEEKSVIWVYTVGGLIWQYSLKFYDDKTDKEFKDLIAQFLWEKNSGKPFSKVKGDDVDWITEAFNDNIKLQDDVPETEYDKLDFVDLEEKEEEEEEEESEEEEEEEEEDGSDEDIQIDGQNSLLGVGYSNDRSFVVRGSQIGVFKHTDDHKLKFSTRTKNIKRLKDNTFFSPKKIMLHERDRSMLLLNPSDPTTIFKMDLERGDVVEEWKTGSERLYTASTLLPNEKYSQTTDEKTLIAMNSAGFMRIDPRIPGDKAVQNHRYFYSAKTRPEFKCAATTGQGHLVAGSKNGDIRLYNQTTLVKPKADPLKSAPQAKTLLPGFGDPIIGVDVSADGRWILATCKYYLLVISTELEGGKTGFEAKMGQKKPIPRRLQLKPEHIVQMGGEINFTPAHFNTGRDNETWILTSTGPFIVTWNFRKVKQGILDAYQVKQYKDVVVADSFRYNDPKSIVVVEPNSVRMATKVIR